MNLTDLSCSYRATVVGGGETGRSTERAWDGAAGRSMTGLHILVVEDESLIALLIGDAVEDAGGTVVGPCFTLAECLRAAREERIDAAILDVNLGGEDVFAAAAELRRRDIPFLFHTAHADRAELNERFGSVTVCRKPMSMNDLMASVARIGKGTATN